MGIENMDGWSGFSTAGPQIAAFYIYSTPVSLTFVVLIVQDNMARF